MAISATEIFRRHPECLEPATAKLFQEGQDPFDLPGLHFTRETAKFVGINNVHGGAIIMAGSGMCTGGRVCHHLQHNLGRAESSVVFVGYAADRNAGTPDHRWRQASDRSMARTSRSRPAFTPSTVSQPMPTKLNC